MRRSSSASTPACLRCADDQHHAHEFWRRAGRDSHWHPGRAADFLFVTPFADCSDAAAKPAEWRAQETTTNIEEGMSNVLAVQSLGGNKQESVRFSTASKESFKRFRSEVFVKLGVRMVGALAFITGQIVFLHTDVGLCHRRHVFTAGDYFVMFYYYFVLSASVFGASVTCTSRSRDSSPAWGEYLRLLDMPDRENPQDGIELPAKDRTRRDHARCRSCATRMADVALKRRQS